MQEQNFIGRMGEILFVFPRWFLSTDFLYYTYRCQRWLQFIRIVIWALETHHPNDPLSFFCFGPIFSCVVHHYFTETQTNYTKPNASPVDNCCKHQSSTARHRNTKSLERGSSYFCKRIISTKARANYWQQEQATAKSSHNSSSSCRPRERETSRLHKRERDLI